jgi:Mg/Co/Ni transporter MgtE
VPHRVRLSTTARAFADALPAPTRPDIAADHIAPPTLLARVDDTVADLLDRARHGRTPPGDALCVVNDDGPLLGVADANGTHSEAVAVRGLSLSRVGLARLLDGELRTGLLTGLALAGASALATVLGLMLPWTLARLGTDPAYGSGPLATVLQNVLTLLIYFGCVSLVVL